MKMSIGSFLIDRLVFSGVSHIYGVPGDYNLEFLELLEDSKRLSFVGTCNELNAAYAADGEARLNGISAVLTTYGVGDLAALPGVAGSYSEGVPVLSISGAPPLRAIRSKALLHHTLADGNYGNVMHCFREFTVAQALITPENAVYEIDRVLQACWREKRPAHLQLPSDICFVEIDVPDRALQLEPAPSDAARLTAAATSIAMRLAHAKRPLLLLDSMVRSHRLARQVERLVERFGLDFATLGSAKAVMSETNPRYLGMYNGKASTPEIFERVAEADCVICLGVRFVDATSGWFSQALDAAAVIHIQPFDVTIGDDYFAGVAAAELLEAIVERETAVSQAPHRHPVLVPASNTQGHDQAWGQNAFWHRIGRFIAPGDVIVAENGTSLAGLSRLKLPEGCSFISQPIWGAIGYTLPALLGTSLAAPDRRNLLFIGDGSFQLTGQELSTILRHGLKPVIFLLNNQGYTIERLILGEISAYNDVANWRYADLPAVLAPTVRAHTFVVNNESKLEAALAAATDPTALTFIELKFERMDAPSGMPVFGKMAREYDYGNWALPR
jgi:TPP-dependent 2-oxoacid decarboxylase